MGEKCANKSIFVYIAALYSVLDTISYPRMEFIVNKVFSNFNLGKKLFDFIPQSATTRNCMNSMRNMAARGMLLDDIAPPPELVRPALE